MEIEGYQIISELSSGGMGKVLFGRKRGAHGFAKLIAIKIIRPHLQQEAQARSMFLDEARLLANLQHPVIAQVHDFGETDGVLYLTLEYVAGESLRAISKRLRRPWPPLAAAQVIAQVCKGLHAAHTVKDLRGRPLGVVHRDVSPHNIMVAFDGNVKILDFGIALARGRETPTTKVGVVKGKFSYMSPEQLGAKSVDLRSDIFSAGLVLYELLTDTSPFPAKSLADLFAVIKDHPLTPPSTIIPALPRGFDDILARALERDPAARFTTAKEMAGQIERVIVEAGGVDLEEFAAAHMAQARSEHQRWLGTIFPDGVSGETVVLAERVTEKRHFVSAATTSEIAPLKRDLPPTRPEGKVDIMSAEASGSRSPIEGETATVARLQPPVEGETATAARLQPPVERKRSRLGWAVASVVMVAALATAGSLASGLFPLMTTSGETGVTVVAAKQTEPTEAPVEPAPNSHADPDGQPGKPPDAEPTKNRTSPAQRNLRQESRELRSTVTTAMRRKGLIAGDHAPLDRLRRELSRPATKANIQRHREHSRQAIELVDGLTIDKEFVGKKLRRFNGRYDRVDDPAARQVLAPILERAMSYYSSGEYDALNDQLNRGFELLEATRR